MEKLLKFEEIPLHYTNEATLIHSFWEGSIIGYDKDTLEPINGKNIVIFFNEMAEVFKSPEIYLIKTQSPVHIDSKTGIFYKRESGSKEKRENLLELYRMLKELPRNVKEDSEFYDYFDEGYPVNWDNIQEILIGFGLREGKEIISELLFKEIELRKVFLIGNRKKTIPDEVTKLFNGLKQSNSKQGLITPRQEEKATETLSRLDIKNIFPSTITDRQNTGFEDFKKTLKRDFQNATRAAVAVIAYCHQQGKRLTRDELQDLLDRPATFPGADALLKYAGKLSKPLIQDIYAELPPKYRHERGQKKKDRKTSETS